MSTKLDFSDEYILNVLIDIKNNNGSIISEMIRGRLSHIAAIGDFSRLENLMSILT